MKYHQIKVTSKLFFFFFFFRQLCFFLELNNINIPILYYIVINSLIFVGGGEGEGEINLITDHLSNKKKKKIDYRSKVLNTSDPVEQE